MRLLYVSTLDHIIHVMLPHLDAARARGWRVEVACRVTRDPAITLAHCDALHDIPFARNPLDPRNLLATAKLVNLIRREKFDIVHCHNPSGGFFGRLAATLAGTKPIRVYTAHGFHFHPLGGKLSNFVYRTIESFAGKYLSDAVLTINQWDFDEAKKLMPPEKVYFTRGVGVSTDEFDPAKVSDAERQKIRDEFSVPEGGFLVTCIGEMIPRKGHELAINNVILLNKDESKQNIISVFVGTGKLLLKLRSMFPDDKNIIFTGFRRDIVAIFAASDVFFLPSYQEGLPCVLQEAMSMEVPSVAFKVRGCSDILTNNEGKITRFGRDKCAVFSLLSGIETILEVSERERREMGRAGRRKMIELYDRPKCVAAWLAIYDELLEKRG